jgi:4-hydroxyphenylacetate 3-monooxygenase/anthranilate 3-monooxygenase (FAD)/4-hydroxyphenylacetate 3-monooxygenase
MNDGKSYLESLRDAREVWVHGERVKDVTAHPAFAPVCREIARIYDLQSAPETRDTMTYVGERGTRVSYSYRLPLTPDDLLRRRRNGEVWARESFGMLGRYPDFCAAMTVGFRDVRDELAKLDKSFGENVVNYHRAAAEKDLCLSHGLHDPAMDKSLRPEQDPDRCLRIVKERDEGLVVRGTRMVTLGALSNEILIAPTYPLNEREKDHAIWFAIPADAPGLKQVCRAPFAPDRNPFDHPVSTRFDEPDTLAIFDDVLVPWERVFLAREPLAAGQLFRSRVMTWASYAAAVQLLAKLELFLGVAHRMAETCGMADRPNVLAELGELATYSQVFQSVVRAAELDCQKTPGGHVAPGSLIHQRALIALLSERLVSILEHVGTSSLIFVPTAEDFQAPELRPLLEVYGRGKDASSIERAKLCRLAWELTADSFGGRHQLYERLHSGDPATIIAAVYQRYDKTKAVEMVKRLLESSGS